MLRAATVARTAVPTTSVVGRRTFVDVARTLGPVCAKLSAMPNKVAANQAFFRAPGCNTGTVAPTFLKGKTDLPFISGLAGVIVVFGVVPGLAAIWDMQFGKGKKM